MHLRFILAMIVMALAFGAAAATEPLESYQPAAERYEFKTRNGQRVDAELGSFSVPENRRKKDSRRITLKYIRFPATCVEPGAPIVYLAGGPGGSGSGTAQGTRFDMFMKLRELGDVIMFDQRGTGMSELLPEAVATWKLPFDQPATREVAELAVREALRESLASWKEDGVDLDAYNTEENADDIAVLAKVLQAEKLRIVGISYGTHLAMSCMRRHKDIVERAVLAGVEGPDHTLKLPSDQQRLLMKIDAWIKHDDKAREAYPDFLGSVERVIGRLKEQPAHVEIGKTEMVITAFDVQNLAAAALRGPESFKRLPKLFAAMDQGDFTPVAYIIRYMRMGRLGAMSIAMDTASWASDARLATIEREAQQTLLSDTINFPLSVYRAELGVRDLGPSFRGPLVSDLPVLAISGSADGRTPPDNAIEALKTLPNGRQLLIEGAGHSDPLFLSSSEILEVMMNFLSGKAVDNQTITLPPIEFEL
jgi:pimeloyl-ACP methyl ester carboxylesterase